MKTDNIILEKSYKFALRIVKLCRYLQSQKNEIIISRQILRSGTSVGANIEEAIGGQSRKDFVAKLQISYKEGRETHYWLRLLRDSETIEHRLANSLIADCEEVLKILGSIIKTTKESL